MIGFRVDAEFLWGFQCKIPGLSKSSPSFTYPPPTVFLGSIAEVLAKDHSLGENMGKKIIPLLCRNLLALGIRPVNCSPIRFADINKLIAIKLTGGKLYPTPEDPYGSFDAPSTGKTLLSPLAGEPPRIRILAIFRDDIIPVRGRDMRLSEHVFWCIHRIGSKESRVSVVEVESFTPSFEKGRAATTFSIPLLQGVKLEKILENSWIYEDVIDPFRVIDYSEDDNPVRNYLESKKLLMFVLPVMRLPEASPKYIINVESPAACYKYGEEAVIGKWPEQS
ncbi:hypothetical protein HRbin01_01610 [archaeon HR01]|nr:hypothetical protein HRbin01_01610 [archaeon HR01]